MEYQSTRGGGGPISAAQAITLGIAPDGGLFIPESLPYILPETLSEMGELNYAQRAKQILSLFLTDYSAGEIDGCIQGAYASGGFDTPAVAPIVALGQNIHMLELWHGPTCAFKDMALQLLPFLMTTAAKKTAGDKTIVILVATSGDTGKAALEGFKDVPKTKIIVFYPEDGVSPMQKLQMVTQEGENVAVCAIKGNFDDAQTGVKALFGNPDVARNLLERNQVFSSANSINWGRLVPQIVYYFSAYCDLVKQGGVKWGEPINICVPTGNFGNILAAYYAKQMGLPVKKLLCASNRNNVLAEFIKTGVYNRNRGFHTTISPSMDILISSNLERLLFDLYDRDGDEINQLMRSLSQTGRYEVGSHVKEKLSDLFWGGWCDDAATKATIRRTFEEYRYLCDTHTAVAVEVCNQYRAETGDETPVVVVSTANPYKFPASVLDAFALADTDQLSEFEKAEKLQQYTGIQAPAALRELQKKPIRFTASCEKEFMEEYVQSIL